MNLIREHIKYLKDNPHGYWFKRKLYGWGWTPVKWQGWAVVFLYIIGSLLLFRVSVLDTVDELHQPITNDLLIVFLCKFILLTGILFFICYRKGEKPKWQWGIQK